MAIQPHQPYPLSWEKPALSTHPQWDDPEYRHAYAEACNEQTVAYQLRFTREHQGLTREQLAAKAGVSLHELEMLEDESAVEPASLQALKKVARALDVAVAVRLVSFSWLEKEAHHLGEQDLTIASFTEEKDASRGK